MDFNTLDKQMRRFEQSMDRTMLDGIYVVARLDGHGFTRLTKKEWDLEKPFDIRFRDAMIKTTSCVRRALHVEMELPIGQEYSQLINKIMNESNRKE